MKMPKIKASSKGFAALGKPMKMPSLKLKSPKMEMKFPGVKSKRGARFKGSAKLTTNKYF